MKWLQKPLKTIYLLVSWGKKNVNQFLQEQNSSSSENTRTNFYPIGKCFCQNCKSLKIGAHNKSVSKALQDILVPNF